MKIYLAPLEGITTYVYRSAYHRNFGGVDRYFTPFIVNKKMSNKEIAGILPENNEGMTLIPQIMSNRAEDFLQVAKEIAAYGYDTVNLNLGCPSGTVVSKKRGAGFLAHPIELERFLDEVYEKCPMQISIKTRIGLDDEEEWSDLLTIYKKFPLEELIVHPRLRTDYYKGAIRYEAFQQAVEEMKVPLCYNGDLNSLEDIDAIEKKFPEVDRIMIGRGVLRRPDFITQIRQTKAGEEQESLEQLAKRIKSFHDDVLEGYRKEMSGDTPTLYKMKELWGFMGECFEGAEKQLKKIRKTTHLVEYQALANTIFSDCPLRENMVKF